jgi:hypothetical protein
LAKFPSKLKERQNLNKERFKKKSGTIIINLKKKRKEKRIKGEKNEK